MTMIQQLLIKLVLAPLNSLMNRFPDKVRDLFFLTGGIGIVVHNFMRNMGLVNYRFLVFFAVNCVFLGLMILGGMGQQIKPVRFHKFLAICWFGIGLLMLQSGIQHNVDYLPEAVLFLVAYPVLFLCWANGDRTRIFRLLLVLCRIAAILFSLGSFVLAPIAPKQYAGMFTNTNMASYFLAVVYAGLTIHILYSRLHWKLLPDILLLGIVAALNYYSNSRTGTLGMICAVSAGLVCYGLTHKWTDILKCLPKIAACAAATVVCISSLVFVFQLRVYLPLPYLDQTTGTLYFVTLPGHETVPTDPVATDPVATDPVATEPSATDPAVTEPLATEPSETDSPTSPTFFDTSGFNELNDKKTSHDDKTLDQYSTGRLSIWKAYASKLNLFGHDSTEPIYVDLLYKEIRTTHMTILQVAYESGIFAGILYLLFNIGTGILSIRYALKRPAEPYAVMPLMFTLVFGVLSLLGSCGVSFWYMVTFYYYVVQFPIMAKPVEETN